MELKLNDFDGFDCVLFDEDTIKLPEAERFKRFYDKDRNTVLIPISHSPVSLEEHQFCHYVYWMTIGVEKLTEKPNIARRFEGHDTPMSHIEQKCFACHYRNHAWPLPKHCPIARFSCGPYGSGFADCDKGSGAFYYEWRHGHDPAMAFRLAHLLWEDKPRKLYT